MVDTTTATRQSSRSLLRISRVSHSLRWRSLPGTNATRRGAWGFQSLQEGAQACSGGLCCTASGVIGSGVGYAIGALDGEDANDGEVWGAQVCMVVHCDVPGEGCLQYRPEVSHGGLTGLTLHATGLDQGVAVFPEVPQPPLTQQPEGESTALIGGYPWEIIQVIVAPASGEGERMLAPSLNSRTTQPDGGFELSQVVPSCHAQADFSEPAWIWPGREHRKPVVGEQPQHGLCRPLWQGLRQGPPRLPLPQARIKPRAARAALRGRRPAAARLNTGWSSAPCAIARELKGAAGLPLPA